MFNHNGEVWMVLTGTSHRASGCRGGGYPKADEPGTLRPQKHTCAEVYKHCSQDLPLLVCMRLFMLPTGLSTVRTTVQAPETRTVLLAAPTASPALISTQRATYTPFWMLSKMCRAVCKNACSTFFPVFALVSKYNRPVAKAGRRRRACAKSCTVSPKPIRSKPHANCIPACPTSMDMHVHMDSA